MRISDEERREVAEDLRNLTISRFIQYKEQFFDELAEVVVGFEDYHDFCVVLDKLADLIDRPTCAIVESYMGDNLESVEEMPYHVLSCGHIAYGEDDPMFCPVCGAAVTDDYR